MSHVLHPIRASQPPLAVSGRGSWITDENGRRYFDACGGAAVSCLGHSDPRVLDAMDRQSRKIPFIHYGFFRNESAEALADRLIAHAPAGLARAMFLSGGSEANEAALKISRQYFLERGEPDRTVFIGRRQSYHGNTLGALSVSGHVGRRELYEPYLFPARFIAPCYAYRDKGDEESLEAYGRRVADLLEAEILAVGPGKVAAFIAEPVVGATLGAVPAVPGYFKRIREICDAHGVLLIFDEVMCGMGRIGTLFACEQDEVVPDIVTFAKGLGGGYQPIGAVLISRGIDDVISKGSGRLRHGQTYVNHASTCAAALAVIDAILEQNLLAAVRDKGAKLMERLQSRFGSHPHIGDIRGKGLFVGLEFVLDRETKEPLPTSCDLAGRLKDVAMQHGLMIYPMSGTVDGRRGDHVVLAPAYIVTDDEIDLLVDRLSQTIDAVFASVRDSIDAQRVRSGCEAAKAQRRA